MANATATPATIAKDSSASDGTPVRVADIAGPRVPPPSSRIALARLLAACALAAGAAAGQPAGFNYDESRVPAYELPELLRFADGRAVETAEQWPARRQEILQVFAEQVYGVAPPAPPDLRFTALEEDPAALGGLARRKQVRIDFAGSADGPSMELLLYTPAGAAGRVGVFLGLNFGGNQTVHADPAIRLPVVWPRTAAGGVSARRAETSSRGSRASRWQAERILKRGYGLATVYCGDIDPDFDDGFRNGVHALAPPRSPKDWGSLAAWAWGLSRALDYLETDERVAADRVAVMGHSRLGKTALWAGARDTRFALVISNNSGCGGAALSRRRFGETVARINASFPHWFSGNFKAYNDREGTLPIDQHMLLALVAPRGLYVASAAEDAWADPKGEFLAARQAGAVYELLGEESLGTRNQPPADRPIGRGAVAYHVRSGKHDVTAYDWDRYLDFADRRWPRD